MVIARTLKTRTARQYRYPLTLQTKGSDDWQGNVTWTTGESFYADIQTRNGRIIVEGNQETQVTKHHIFTGWRPSLKLTQAESMRLQSETGELFYVESIEDLNREHREVEIVTTLRIDPLTTQAIVTHTGDNIVTHLGERIVTHVTQ